MKSVVAMMFLLPACRCLPTVPTADFHPQVTANLIADVQAHFYAGCVYILHSSVPHHKELMSVWKAAAGLLNVGVLHTRQLMLQASGSCVNLLYVVLNRDQQTLSQVSAAGRFSGARWLVFLPPKFELSNLEIPFDCELLVVQWGSKVTQLSEVYRASPELPLQIRHYGDWRLGSHRKWPSLGLYRRRTSLDGHVIKAAVLEDETYVFLDRTGSRETLTGYIGYIWSELERELNFTSALSKSVDGGTGSKANGTWDGMVGMLVRGEAVVGASSFLMTTERMDAVDYTYSLADAPTNVYIRRPEVYSLPWTSSLAPFSSRLWFCVLAVLAILTVALSIICTIERRHGNRNELPFGLRDSWLSMLGIFCQQGHYVTPRSSPGRMVCFTAHLCAAVLLAGYAGNYISVLSAGRPLLLPFTSFRGMLDHGSYRLGAMPRSAQLDFFDEATDPLSKEIYKKLILPDIQNLPLSYADAFKRVCDSKYAFMSSPAMMRQFNRNVNCTFISLPQANIPGVIAMTTVKEFPYRGLINYNLLKMRNAGLTNRLQRRTLPAKVPPQYRDWATIGLAEVAPTVSIFALGVLVSVLLLALELCSARGSERGRDDGGASICRQAVQRNFV